MHELWENYLSEIKIDNDTTKITEKKIENYMKTTTKLIKQFTELEEDCKIILLNILIYN